MLEIARTLPANIPIVLPPKSQRQPQFMPPIPTADYDYTFVSLADFAEELPHAYNAYRDVRAMAGIEKGSKTSHLRPQDFPEEWVKFLNDQPFPDETQDDVWDSLRTGIDVEGFVSGSEDGVESANGEDGLPLTDQVASSRLSALRLDDDPEEGDSAMRDGTHAPDPDLMEVDMPGECHIHVCVFPRHSRVSCRISADFLHKSEQVDVVWAWCPG